MKFNQFLLFIALFFGSSFVQSMKIEEFLNEEDINLNVQNEEEGDSSDQSVPSFFELLLSILDLKERDLAALQLIALNCQCSCNHKTEEHRDDVIDHENADKINQLVCTCECAGCNESFKNAQKLHEHLCEKHMEVISQRITCSWKGCINKRKEIAQPFNSEDSAKGRGSLKRHFKIHAKYYAYQCTQCDSVHSLAFERSYIKQHCNFHHGDKNCYRKISYI